MATYDLNRGELNALLASDHADPSARKAVIDYLMADGDVGRNSRVDVQVGGGSLDPNAQVLILDGTGPATVTPDGNLKVVVDVADSPWKLDGSDNSVVALAGNDTVDASASTGNNVFITGGANDSFDWSLGGSDPYGGFNTLVGGLGKEDNGSPAHGGGNDSITGGSGDDLFLVGRAGNDTIDGGGGNNTVMFDDSSANATQNTSGGVTTVQFSDTGQTITLSNVQNIVFTDHH